MVKGQIVPDDERSSESCLHCEISDPVQEHVEGQEKFDLARRALEPLAGAKDRQLQSQAKGLLESIKRYEEQVARYKSEAANATGAHLSKGDLLLACDGGHVPP